MELYFVLVFIILITIFLTPMQIKILKWKYKSDEVIKKIIHKELEGVADYIVNISEPSQRELLILDKKSNFEKLIAGSFDKKLYFRIVIYRKNNEFVKKMFKLKYNIFEKIEYEFLSYE